MDYEDVYDLGPPNSPKKLGRNARRRANRRAAKAQLAAQSQNYVSNTATTPRQALDVTPEVRKAKASRKRKNSRRDRAAALNSMV